MITKLFSRSWLLVLLILSTLSSNSSLATSLIMGNIQFPQSLGTVPTLRIYCGGHIIASSIDQKNKTLSFSIPKYGQQFHYSILVTEKISFARNSSKYQAGESNTAAFMRLDPGQPYKLYSLLLVPDLDQEDKKAAMKYVWRIKNETIYHKDLKVPDDAIVICCNPEWISHLRPQNGFELPTITITENITEQSPSLNGVGDLSAKIMLAALDSDPLHAMQKERPIKQKDNRITIAAPTA